MDKKVAIIGSGGLVGGYLAKEFTGAGGNEKPILTIHSGVREGFYPLDITDRGQLRRFIAEHCPDVVIFAAAMTHVDRCEEEKGLCFKANVESVENTIRFLKETKKPFRFVFFSTEYIFDGKQGPYQESAQPNPLSVYGTSKWMAEELIRRETANHLIVRIAGVYGREPAEKNFFYTVRRYLTQNKTLRVPGDQVSSPTYAGHIARVVKGLVQTGRKGTFHVAGSTLISRSDFAAAIARRFGWDSKWIEPAATAELGQKAKRPLKGGLIPSSIEGIANGPALQESLEEFYAEQRIHPQGN
ncbi:MAG: NAD(P)-dependent oxidoreductase [Candidatus Omnitrophica bacterium]|nr:NAD(P)-dependent oxidoreductase [Candidatus Omnitrophota bacterium]